MIKLLTLWNFRKVEHQALAFTPGLNVLRGPNECSKTTRFEGILYALYGSAALVDTLAETVTWGKKESELKAELVIEISEVEYTFTRSKAGAECNYDGIKVTGQKEVTAFAAALLGADAKTASVLMLSSQAGLRGALDEGATAVSALMGKLADFELIDRILQNAASTLSLGSLVPVQAKLADADAEVLTATAALVDPADIQALDVQIAVAEGEHSSANSKVTDLSDAVTKADDARDDVTRNNRAFEAARSAVSTLVQKVSSTSQSLTHAEQESGKRAAHGALTSVRDAVTTAKNHATLTAAYQTFQSLGEYPTVAWDSDKASNDAEVSRLTLMRDAANRALDTNVAETAALRRTLIAGDGVCPTCKRAADNHDHVLQHNAAVQTQIDELTRGLTGLRTTVAEPTNDLTLLAQVKVAAERRQAIINKVAQYVTLDESVYPCKVVWAGSAPGPAPDVKAVEAELKALEAQDTRAAQAQGMVTAHRATLVTLAGELKMAEAVAANIVQLDPVPLQAAYDAAFQAYSQASTKARELGYVVQNLKNNRTGVERSMTEQQAKLAASQARVIELTNDIKTLEFNNELVRKLKSMKPMITDHLWNNVLAAVSNFFSQLRGEQSIVTKDAAGFKVNGRGGSLSGSTLDMLALAIRVALSKTFVPHANFMVLDEPAHGCDNVRASALLGFLAGAGFNQTILASHDELSESVANNVITLGA